MSGQGSGDDTSWVIIVSSLIVALIPIAEKLILGLIARLLRVCLVYLYRLS